MKQDYVILFKDKEDLHRSKTKLSNIIPDCYYITYSMFGYSIPISCKEEDLALLKIAGFQVMTIVRYRQKLTEKMEREYDAYFDVEK